MLPSSFHNLFPVPGLGRQSPLFLRSSFYPVFKSPEYHFHENGLWTDPSAKDPAIYHRKEYDEDHEGQHTHCKDKEVLRPENEPEQDELPFRYVEQEKRMSIHFNEWQCKEHHHIKDGQPRPVVIESSKGLGSKYPFSMPLLVGCINPISECA